MATGTRSKNIKPSVKPRKSITVPPKPKLTKRSYGRSVRSEKPIYTKK